MLVAFVKRGSPHLCTEVYTGIEESKVQKPKVKWNSGGGRPHFQIWKGYVRGELLHNSLPHAQ